MLRPISNSAILRNNYISLLSDLCTCVHVKKKWHRKRSHSSSVTSNSDGLAHYSVKNAAVLKTVVKESRKSELAHLKKKKKEKHFGRLATFWFGAFEMLCSATGCVFHHENTQK